MHPTIICVIMCVRLCVFLLMFWNPKEVITPVAGELRERCAPFQLGVGAGIPVEAGEGLSAP